MTEHQDKLDKRKEELIEEQMDKTWVSIYAQWDKDNPDTEDYSKTIYASGREVTNDLNSDWYKVKYREPMRRWLFREVFNIKDS